MSNYPNSPGYKRLGTSQEAATEVKASSVSLTERVLKLLQREGGLTADQCAEKIEASVLAVRPRLSELLKKGLVRETAERRKNKSGKSAMVYRAVYYEGKQKTIY